MSLWIVHTGLAAIAFFLVNWLGEHSISAGYYRISFIARGDDPPAFNTVFRVLAPLVYSILVASLLYYLGLDDWVQSFYRVTILYFAIRWGFNVVVGRARLLSWSRQFFIAGVSIWLAFLIYDKVLRFKHNLLPDPQTLANELWVIILIFIYATANKLSWPFGTNSSVREKNYIHERYRVYNAAYGEVIRAQASSRVVEATTFAVLIYESFNRPRVYQWMERWVFHPLGLAKSFGPMQVQSEERIDDATSVELGAKKIAADFPLAEADVRERNKYFFKDREQPLPKSWYSSVAAAVARRYNVRSDYPHEVSGIFQELVRFNYPDLADPG